MLEILDSISCKVKDKLAQRTSNGSTGKTDFDSENLPISTVKLIVADLPMQNEQMLM